MSEIEENHEEELKKILPFIKSWKSLYTIVIGELILLIIAFYLFSNYFA